MEEEIWKPLIENPDYEVSNLSRVRSLDRAIKAKDNRIYYRKGKILKLVKSPKGYLCFNIHIQGKMVTRYISRLVAIYFIPNPNNYPCVLHKNDIKDDNRLENLYWGDDKMNRIDRTVNKKWYGDNHPNSKITVEQANEIRELLKEGKLTQSAIGKRYGVATCTVSHIKNGSERKYDNL